MRTLFHHLLLEKPPQGLCGGFSVCQKSDPENRVDRLDHGLGMGSTFLGSTGLEEAEANV
jgi:hypothetical protein